MNKKNESWAPARRKKQSLSWLGAGVKARTIKAVGNNIEARQKLANNGNDGYLMTEIKNTIQQQQQNRLEASLPYLGLDMMSKYVLVLVQDTNSALNIPGGSVQNRLAPPMPISKYKKKLRYFINGLGVIYFVYLYLLTQINIHTFPLKIKIQVLLP